MMDDLPDGKKTSCWYLKDVFCIQHYIGMEFLPITFQWQWLFQCKHIAIPLVVSIGCWVSGIILVVYVYRYIHMDDG